MRWRGTAAHYALLGIAKAPAENLFRRFVRFDTTECSHKSKQDLQANNAIEETAGLGYVSRVGRGLNDLVLLEYMEPRGHQSGILIEDIEAHGPLPSSQNAEYCSAEEFTDAPSGNCQSGVKLP